MAEYIDREELLKYIDEHTNQDEWLVNQYNADWIYNFIDSRPTADVVPKSEVEKARQHGYELGKREIAREIFAEIEMLVQKYYHDEWYLVNNMEHDIAELKKKYTEEKE